MYRLKNFSTIRFYIILKHSSGMFHSPMCFSTIRFYIILKRVIRRLSFISVSVPYVFTSFSNNVFIFSPLPKVSVPYVFTSFSNILYLLDYKHPFQYHTFLHHSQTPQAVQQAILLFQYHTFLHHSQTMNGDLVSIITFQYHTFLHHSQTDALFQFRRTMFQYHTFLHHSQTSNSKMNRHHLRKTRYSNTFNRFHIDLYL